MNIEHKSKLLSVGLLSLLVTVASAKVEEQAERILKMSGITGGLVVHLDCGDGNLTAALRRNENLLVHGLDTDKAVVEKARRNIREHSAYGPVSVDAYDGKHLPYIDNVVNLVVAEGELKMPMEEVMRVICPLGKAYVNGKMLTKPLPKEIDEWTHYLHGPDNNAVANDTVVGPPRRLQWVSAPRWTRDHDFLNSISSVVTVGGRLFYVLDEEKGYDSNKTGKWVIIAKDAYNGVQLWRRDMASWADNSICFRSGPPQLPRLLVASEKHVYAPLGLSLPVSQMDAKTGKVLKTFEATTGAEEILLTEKFLLVLKSSPVVDHAVLHTQFRDIYDKPRTKSIVSIDPETGKTFWTAELNGLVCAETMAAAGNSVYIQVDERVVCLEMGSGKERWVYGNAGEMQSRKAKPGALRNNYGKYVLVVSDGVVLCQLGKRNLVALSAESGEKLWSSQGGGGFHSPLDLFVINGLVWTGDHPKDSTAPPPKGDYSMARELHTGKVVSRNDVMVHLQSAGHHHRCYRNKASLNYIMSGKRGIEFFNLNGENHSRNNWIRGTCQYGIMPANGLIYAPPNSCACYSESLIRGFYAMAPEGPKVVDPDRPRLEKGSARIPAESQSVKHALSSNDWSTFRGDSRRSGVVSSELPEKMSEKWRVSAGGRLAQPVISAGTLLVSDIDQHRVLAYDSQNGKLLWSRTVGGRVDSPPTIYRGQVCLFGCADGYVYCLRLSDGELVWRFLAARSDRRTVSWERLESIWPVHGSVLILNDIAYVSAGRSTWFDHGIELYGLEPLTGEILHHANFESQPPIFGKGKDEKGLDARAQAYKEQVLKQSKHGSSRADYKSFMQSDQSVSFSMAGGTVSDLLVSDGQDVYLHQVRFNSSLEKQAVSNRHLLSTSGLLHDPTEDSRTHWIIGDGDFSRYAFPYHRFVGQGDNNPACGSILSYDHDTSWGILRVANWPGKVSDHDLIAIPLSSKGKEWKVSLGSFMPRSLLKSGGQLVLCGIVDGKYVLQIRSSASGELVSSMNLNDRVIWDGMAAAEQRLYLSTEEGDIICYDGNKE